MPSIEYLIDEPSVGWTEPDRPDRKNRGFFVKGLADGEEGRPYAVIGRQPEGFLNPAHLHTEPQFQVLLEGSVSFPKKPLTPVAVHYSDANVPYGPFLVGKGLMLAVVRCRSAGQLYMSDREGRRRRNPRGREFYGQSEEVPWEELDGGLAGLKRKVLLGKEGEQPQAELRQYPPGHELQREPAPFGRFHILLKGTAQFGDHRLEPYSMLFERGDAWPTSFKAGDEGATLLSLAFDQV